MSKARDVVVAVAPSREIAEMWAGLLDEAGIAYRLTPAHVGDTGLVPSLAAWELRVDAIDASRALELLPSANDADLDELEDDEDAAEEEEGNDAYDPDLDAPPVTGGGGSIRWLVIAAAVVIALIIIFFGARYVG